MVHGRGRPRHAPPRPARTAAGSCSGPSGRRVSPSCSSLTFRAGSANEIWSPYYRINTYIAQNGELYVNVNGIPHQALHPVDAEKEEFYDQLYKWFPGRTYENVLIVGAGSGTDVAVALRNGAGHVDAVEIDRAIQKLGIDNHPNQPYQDPRVTRHENDGRAFLRGTDQQYDLVIFALPDSLTLVSTTANIRLESFLFTQQAFESVRDHLAPGGVFVLYNYYREPWLISKISQMLDDTFESPPILRMYDARKATFAVGPQIDALGGGPPPGDFVDQVPAIDEPEPKAASDDWPFLYLRTPFVAPHYLAGSGVRAADRRARRVRRGARRRHVRAAVQPALLRAGHRVPAARDSLARQLLAVVRLDVARQRAGVLRDSRLRAARDPRQRAVPDPSGRACSMAALFVALAVAFMLPPESLLIDPPWLRYLLAGVVAFAPVFLANLVFTYSFRDTKHGRHGLRVQPARRDGRRRAGVPRAARRATARS